MVCQSVANLSAKSRTFNHRRCHATSASDWICPFGSHEENPTESIVNAFPSLLPIKNPFGRGSSEMSIEKRILSVDHAGSIWTATQLDSREWDAILHLGLCGECTRPRIELQAEDLLDMRIPDNSGRQVNGAQLSGMGNLPTSVPVKKWRLDDWEFDLDVSMDAGKYICNETYYRSLEALHQHQFAIPCLFLHLPSTEHMSLNDATKLVRKTLNTCCTNHRSKSQQVCSRRNSAFLAMKRGPNEPKAGKWEFPGGTIEQNESPEDALLRELNEELNVEATIVKKAAFGRIPIPFSMLKFMHTSSRQRM